ncbi:MAG: MBL fold metallo-hydrolase [Lachnospiraceae bacterium]|nr:MBL fold metallo-hydrolase [Lachnospiraceae bacterium]
MKLTILGARGSVPVEGKEYLEFGGSTSCILAETDDHAIYLDAGSGIVKTPDIGDKSVSVLLSHPHIDHMLGMPFFPYLACKDRRIDFYARTLGEASAGSQLDSLFSEPLWPVTVDGYACDFVCHDVTGPFDIGDVHVEWIESVHPGGGTIYKLTHEAHSIVYATDYEYDEARVGELIDFARGCDVLFFDAMYTDEEASERKGYGHSSIAQGLEVVQRSGAKSVRFVHHDPRHDDEFLRKMESTVKSEKIRLARNNEVIFL